MEELWDIARVAEYLGVSERTVYNRVRSGHMPAIKIGRLWRVRPSELERWLSGGEVSAAAGGSEVPGPYPYTSAVEPTTLGEARALPARDELERAVGTCEDLLVRRMSFVALLSTGVEALGWPAPVVVGGHAVEFYTAGDYPTQDIDLVGASEPVAEVLDSWGFCRQGRHWYDDTLGLVVEMPGGTLNAEQRAHVVSVAVAGATAYVLGVEDLIIDRLSACVFWDDDESCRWARVLVKAAFDLDVEYLSRRVREESLGDAFIKLGVGDRL